jgi:hypothetical protein
MKIETLKALIAVNLSGMIIALLGVITNATWAIVVGVICCGVLLLCVSCDILANAGS